MYNDSALFLLAVGLGWFVLLRRHNAFRLRNDFWSMLATLLVIPALVVKILWPELPEKILMAAVTPSFLMLQYALFLATVCETEKLRTLRREVPRWRILTGTAPKGYVPARVTGLHRERRLSPRTLGISAAVAAAIGIYAVLCFGWGSLVVLAVFFWAFMALYQFSFSPDNQ